MVSPMSVMRAWAAARPSVLMSKPSCRTWFLAMRVMWPRLSWLWAWSLLSWAWILASVSSKIRWLLRPAALLPPPGTSSRLLKPERACWSGRLQGGMFMAL